MAVVKHLLLLLALNGTLIHKVSTCTDDVEELIATDDWQFILSHEDYNGRQRYDNNYDKCWRISTEDNNTVVHMVAVDFEVEEGWLGCTYDVLHIYDDEHAEGNHAERCGWGGFEVISSNGEMYLEFYTDISVTYAGFKLKYKQVDSHNYNASYWTTTPRPVWTNPTNPTNYGSTTTSPNDDDMTFVQVVGIIFGIVLGILVMVVIICIGCVICVTKANTPGRSANPNPQVVYTNGPGYPSSMYNSGRSANPNPQGVYTNGPGYPSSMYNSGAYSHQPPPYLPAVENFGATAVVNDGHVYEKAPIPD